MKTLPNEIKEFSKNQPPIKPAPFWQKGAILWLEVAHSYILRSVIFLINPTCFTYSV